MYPCAILRFDILLLLVVNFDLLSSEIIDFRQDEYYSNIIVHFFQSGISVEDRLCDPITMGLLYI